MAVVPAMSKANSGNPDTKRRQWLNDEINDPKSPKAGTGFQKSPDSTHEGENLDPNGVN